MTTILLVECEHDVGSALQTSLTAQHYDVTWVRAGSEALNCAVSGAFALVLLELKLPDRDGFEVCRAIRKAQPSAAIIIHTARADESDVIRALESGADDYLFKPVRLQELLARLRAHVRRRPTEPAKRNVRRVGSLRVDLDARRAWLGNGELTLRAKEFDLLARLAAQPGQYVSRTTLMTSVWGEPWFGSTKTLDVHIASLRRKLSAPNPAAVECGDANTAVPTLVTLRGRGYRLEPGSQERPAPGMTDQEDCARPG